MKTSAAVKELGPWSVNNRTSDAEILSQPNNESGVNDTSLAPADAAIGMKEGVVPVSLLCISQREPLNKLFKRSKAETRQFKTQ